MSDDIILPLLHFNDVYHLEPFRTEPVGGFARFANTAKSWIEDQKTKFNRPEYLFTFGGDVFNPSVESSITKGKHMLPALNYLGIDVSCYGNHDFDFGVETLMNLTAATNYPWIMSNVWSTQMNRFLANGREYVVLERYGLRIGFIGLVEPDWLETITHLPPVEYRDFVTTGRDLARRLKRPLGDDGGEGVDLVFALTHMRFPNDQRLSNEVPEIDLILGGHDHDFFINSDGVVEIEKNVYEGKVRVIKTGCDFRELSLNEVTIQPKSDGAPARIRSIKVTRKEIVESLPEDPEALELVKHCLAGMGQKLQQVIGRTRVMLDARGSICRTRESNMGNLATDLLRITYNSDIGLVVGGTIRSDTTYGPGNLTIRDIIDIFPFDDPCVVIRIKGSDLYDALENGFSALPKTEGRFPQVSGLKIRFDSRLPPYKRIVDVHIIRSGPETCLLEKLEMDKFYTVATREYLSQGHDGFESLTKSTLVVDSESGMLLSTILRRFFIGIKVVNRFRAIRSEQEKISRDAFTKWRRLVKDSFQSKDHLHHHNFSQHTAAPAPRPLSERPYRVATPPFVFSEDESEWDVPEIEPEVENRIVDIAHGKEH
ncbi:2,3-cyclic-nucleotide 2-phosphodiesterase [Polychytrium aggregatum]|uniref:2,3-cyclic-nucleotide 2-phosphodiesterase n=1 Tax=Polychytrium aggregatum TaxID=110093 RepID=UPI0022FF342A|nr:2,3-cyclic-nucleotide 2-phosphodiesterase [Polychytrium aggregatum]KAI9208304.1 2,3-cyclic-nucleotide 2-phosphodiesterase [Polychytrium aggregatum]